MAWGIVFLTHAQNDVRMILIFEDKKKEYSSVFWKCIKEGGIFREDKR